MKRFVIPIIIWLCLQFGFGSSVPSAMAGSVSVKELNFVFLHGGGGTSCDLQLLADSIMEQLPAYIRNYEQVHLGTKIQVDTLSRCYPNDVDIATWASNIADSIDKYFYNKKNLVLIGHSVGGKAALYATAKNVGGLADKVALVVTINAPVKALDKYYVTGGGSISDYCRARWLLSDRGICGSVAYYDSSEDGNWVSHNKRWLALISCESAPSSRQFDVGGVDAFPRDMDDGSIPVSAQYSDGADVVYYGEHGHSDFEILDKVANSVAGIIMDYLFGKPVECSVFAKGSSFEHRADWVLGTDYWQDLLGEVLSGSGQVWHMNESYTQWQEWEDIIGECPHGDKRSRYEIKRVRSSVLFTSIERLGWLSRDNLQDCRLYLRTQAAPRNYIQVDWSIYRRDLLPEGARRDHYEVEIVSGTPLTQIGGASWVTDDPRDLRIQVWSQAESPFQWFKAQWRVYYREIRQREVIDGITFQPFLETTAIDEGLDNSLNTCCD